MVLKLGPTPEIVSAPVLDWSKTTLSSSYKGSYAKVLDNVFTPEECAALIALGQSGSKWTPAALHFGMGDNEAYIDKEHRDSERISRFDHDSAEKLYQRLLPYVQELVEIREGSQWETIINTRNRVRGVWRLVGLNERLSFLRYGKGNYFREHCDGQLELPDGRKSRVTVQIYLGDDGVQGGSTRILGRRNQYLDVLPKKGRVLVFQQRGLWHSGEDVTEGVKYTLRSDFMFRQTYEI